MKKIGNIWFMAIVAAGILATAPVNANKMDSRIESSAKQSYVFKNYLKDDDVNIQSKDGVVTLKGEVANESHKSLAEDTVSSLPGVNRVNNQLRIEQSAANPSSDGWIATKVKSSLLFHRNVSGTNTKVDVKDGIVTLSGEAESQAQKDLTTEYVKDIDGVQDVRNEMSIAMAAPENAQKSETMGEKIDDASITAQVKMTLLYHRSTSALRTKIDTNEGMVTLTGHARSAAEKDLVTKLTSNVRGVRSVNNQMTIESDITG